MCECKHDLPGNTKMNDVQFAMVETEGFDSTRPIHQQHGPAPRPQTVRTRRADREINGNMDLAPPAKEASAPAEPVGDSFASTRRAAVNLFQGTVKKCTRACQGAAQDVQQWNDLPGKSAGAKLHHVCTNRGRFPYLLLVASVCFAIFVALFALVGRRPSPPYLSGGMLDTMRLV